MEFQQFIFNKMQQSVNQQIKDYNDIRNKLNRENLKNGSIKSPNQQLSEIEQYPFPSKITQKNQPRNHEISHFSHSLFPIEDSKKQVKNQSNKSQIETNEYHNRLDSKQQLTERIIFKFNDSNLTQKKQLSDFQPKAIIKGENIPTANITIKDTQAWRLNVASSQIFQKQHPQFCKDGLIVFPVQDSLFSLYPNILSPFYLDFSEIQPEPLPQYFEPMLGTWNTIQTFSSYFLQDGQRVTLSSVKRMIENDERFMILLFKILDIFVKQLTNEKNELIKKSKYFDFFGVLKFCFQNGLLEKIYQRFWAYLCLSIINIFCQDNQQLQNPCVSELIKSLALDCENVCPSNILLRCNILSYFSQLLAETNQFRKMMLQKIEISKKTSKKLTQIEEKKKKTLKQFSKIEEQERFALKQKRKIDLQRNSSQKDAKDIKQFQQQLGSKVQQIRNKKVELLLKLNQIEDDLKQITSHNILLTCVQTLGQDKDQRLYWIVFAHPEIIFVSRDNKWSFYSFNNIPKLLGRLNLRGHKEYSLYKNIQTHLNSIKLNEVKFSAQFLPFTEHNNEQESYDERESMNGAYRQIKDLFTEGEKRLTQYLQQRNSRWGTEYQRSNFYEFISRMKDENLSTIVQNLRIFNEKVCVVQTQYRLINQQSSQQVNTKVRKVQTKIWGVSEKYKHHWQQFLSSAHYFCELFFLIYVFCLNIQKYTSKNRKKRKQFQIIRQSSRYMKSANCRKDQLSWEELCSLCKQGGQLLCCDMCTQVFHLQCLGLSDVPEQKFLCQGCERTRNIRKLLRKSKN